MCQGQGKGRGGVTWYSVIRDYSIRLGVLVLLVCWLALRSDLVRVGGEDYVGWGILGSVMDCKLYLRASVGFVLFAGFLIPGLQRLVFSFILN